MTAIKNHSILSIPPSTATIGPPCATLSPTPPIAAIAAATIAPIIFAGIIRNGSCAANGIAPSVIPNKPIVNDALPISISPLLNLRLLIKVARPKPIGGVHTATATIPITA